MKELSIFVDESGDLGETSDFYLIALVFHSQEKSILPQMKRYKDALARKGLDDIPLHAGPLINGKDGYKGMDKDQRLRMLAAFRTFVDKLPFEYICLAYQKRNFNDETDKLAEKMRKDLVGVFFAHLDQFQTFDKVKIYYDNGQSIVRKAVHDSVEHALAKEAIIYKDALPNEYRLFQVADYICTIELTDIKFNKHQQTATDGLFFGTYRMFKKNFLRKLRIKQLV